MSRVRQVTVPDLAADGWETVPAGTILEATMPRVGGPIVLRLNGAYRLRADWPVHVRAADDVEWLVHQPQDREDFRTILAVAAVVASFATAGTSYAWVGAAFTGANIAYNLLVPPSGPPEQDKAKSVYSASLSGNQAKLDQPIPRTCGVDRRNPDYAGTPYYVYDANGDQYIYAVLCLGYGPHDILADFVGSTPVSSFADVLVHAYLKPGQQPSQAKANIVQSSEVGGQELVQGKYVPGGGGYPASQEGRAVAAIGYDIIAPQGLGNIDGDSVTASWQVEYQQIDDGGAPLSDWSLLDTGSFTMNTNTPVRRSFLKELPSPMRVQIRFARTNLKATDAATRDMIQVGGLRGHLAEAAPLNALSSHYEVVMRASEQLTGQSQNDFNLILAGKCRTWSPSDGWSCEIGDFDNYVATRNPAWWLADLCSDPNWGEGLADERIDLLTLHDLAAVWDARQDRFDYTFSSATDAWSAGQMIAAAGRARMFRRAGSVRSFARDELVESVEDAITPRMCVRGSEMTITDKHPKSSDPDAYIVEYQSNRTWSTARVLCPCPGVSESEVSRPQVLQLTGVRGFNHAKREGLYHAADMALRRRTMTARVEMMAIRATVLQPYRFLPQIPGYGQTGDVVSWDALNLVMSLTERADFSGGETYLRLRRDDGSVTAPVKVTPGATPWDIVLPEAPDFELVCDDGTRARPVFLLGPTTGDELAKVSSIRPADNAPKGSQFYDIEFVADDDRVHTADLAYLPGGEEQDPIMLPGDPSSGDVLIVNLAPPLEYTLLSALTISGPEASLTFHPDGTATKVDNQDLSAYNPNIATVWLLFGAVDPSTGALYEIRFTARPDIVASDPRFEGASQHAPNSGDALDTWLSLSAARTVGMQAGAGGAPASIIGAVLVEIRKVGATALSGSAIAYLGNTA